MNKISSASKQLNLEIELNIRKMKIRRMFNETNDEIDKIDEKRVQDERNYSGKDRSHSINDGFVE